MFLHDAGRGKGKRGGGDWELEDDGRSGSSRGYGEDGKVVRGATVRQMQEASETRATRKDKRQAEREPGGRAQRCMRFF